MADMMVAWICCVVACLGFGTNFLPVKKTEVKDGQYFCLWMTLGIFLVGVIDWLISGVTGDGLPKFYPVAMLGGAIWAVGNLMVPFIVKNCGLGIGQLVWGATNMLTGWATGRFGLFGIEPQTISNGTLNYIGVALAVIALVLFTQMGGKKKEDKLTEVNPADVESAQSQSANGGSYVLGLVVALITGVFFGSNFDPPTILQQKGQHGNSYYSKEASDYVLSHFAGILAFTIVTTSCFKLFAKECHTGNNVILPGLVCGALWGIAQCCWFVANGALSFVISFPIIVGIPGVIAAVLSVILFKENSDPRSLKILAAIIVIQAASLGCIAASH